MSKYPEDDWLDKARLAIYEETKDMASAERVAYINAQAAPVYEEFSIKHISAEPVDYK
ncbi:hypothetical protein FACS1894187_23760 [Synergistales bacterium]|nr:hypothetical protein FACS1894187_23760 [Synergistales bacterium]